MSKRFLPRDRRSPVTLALDEVSTCFQAGTVTGVIGSNGAGKSTLLKVAAGILAPTQGTVSRLGKTCAVIDLGAATHPDLTGRENLELLAAVHGVDLNESGTTARELLEFAEVSHAAATPTRFYSTGMLARLSLSVALHATPAVLLLDEALSVGDIEFQERCRQRVVELRDTGTAVVLVSHDPDLVTSVCERALWIDHGTIVEDGPVEQTVGRYLGIPDVTDASDPRVQLTSARCRVRPGEPLELCIERPTTGSARYRLDIVVPSHPNFAGLGVDRSIVFGSSSGELSDTTRSGIFLETRHLPPGRYQIHLAIEADGEIPTLRAAPLRFVVEGPRPRPYAIQLDSTSSIRPVDGVTAATEGSSP